MLADALPYLGDLDGKLGKAGHLEAHVRLSVGAEHRKSYVLKTPPYRFSLRAYTLFESYYK